MNSDLVQYYKERAAEYEQLYLRPERQHHLAKAAAIFKKIFAGKRILEIACGTGYWTQHIAETATSILATDINKEVLDIAMHKPYPKANVSFAIADFNSYSVPEKYDALFGGYIWSHIELQELNTFLNTIANFVIPGGTIVFTDNIYVESSSTPIAETDKYGNTYQHRKLTDGSMHRVLKNFPDENFLRNSLQGRATDIEFIDLKYYWILKFKSVP